MGWGFSDKRSAASDKPAVRIKSLESSSRSLLLIQVFAFRHQLVIGQRFTINGEGLGVGGWGLSDKLSAVAMIYY